MRFWIIVDALCRCRLSSSSFFVLIESDSLIFHPRWRWAVLFTADILFSIFSVTSRSVHRCDALIIIIIAQPLTCWITEQLTNYFISHHTQQRGANFSLSHFFFSINSTRLCVVLCSPFFSYHVKAHHQQLSIIYEQKNKFEFSRMKSFPSFVPSSLHTFQGVGLLCRS